MRWTAGLLLGLLLPLPAAASGVVVLRSSDVGVYRATAAAFRTAYRGPVVELSLSGLDPNSVIEAVRREAPEVVVAVGLRAAVLVREQLPRTPLVYTMVPSPERHDLVGAWVTGIAADIPPAMELAALHQLAPEVREVGVLIGADRATWIRDARAAADHLGIRLDVATIGRVEDLGPQVRDLVARAQAIWLPADPSVATPEAFRFTLDLAITHRLPLLAFAPGLVRAGALTAAAPDLVWVGERTAEAVRRIRAGERAGDVPSTDMRRVRVIANLATARAIGLEISPQVLHNVELVP